MTEARRNSLLHIPRWGIYILEYSTLCSQLVAKSDVPFEVPLFCKMKQSLSGLVLLATLFTPTISAPLERGHGMLHRLSPHHGLSRRIQAASEKRPLNLTFTPIRAGDVPVYVEYGASTQLQTSDFRFSATLLKLGLDDDTVDAERRDTQVAFRSADTYGGRHVVISTRTYHSSIAFRSSLI